MYSKVFPMWQKKKLMLKRNEKFKGVGDGPSSKCLLCKHEELKSVLAPEFSSPATHIKSQDWRRGHRGIFVVQIQWNTLVSKSKEEKKKNLIKTPNLNLWLLHAYTCTLVMVYLHTQISEKFQIEIGIALGVQSTSASWWKVNSFINVVGPSRTKTSDNSIFNSYGDSG